VPSLRAAAAVAAAAATAAGRQKDMLSARTEQIYRRTDRLKDRQEDRHH